MPLVELSRDWQAGRFVRTIHVGGKAKTILFERRKPVELTDAELAAVQAAGGAPLVLRKTPPDDDVKQIKKRKGESPKTRSQP